MATARLRRSQFLRCLVAAAFLVVALAAGVAAPAAAQSQRFPDVAPDHYAFEAVEWAAEVGVTTGYTDGTFKPERVGAGNSAVVVDLQRCQPMLSSRVPNLVPIPGVTGSAHCAVRPLEEP